MIGRVNNCVYISSLLNGDNFKCLKKVCDRLTGTNLAEREISFRTKFMIGL